MKKNKAKKKILFHKNIVLPNQFAVDVEKNRKEVGTGGGKTLLENV